MMNTIVGIKMKNRISSVYFGLIQIAVGAIGKEIRAAPVGWQRRIELSK
jgi:hypothetical protein